MTPEELAEDTLAYVVPSAMFEPVERDGYVFVAARTAGYAVRVRRLDEGAVHAEARERGLARVEWWLGPHAPPGGEPQLVGMTCATAPPEVPAVELRPAEAGDVQAVERAVWGEAGDVVDDPAVRHTAAFVDGELAGYGRSVDLHGGVALMGGAVLPDFRGRGVYRALVRARWDHAVARGTPLLVVQAGPQSAPILAGLGFEAHGEIRVLVDRL